MIRSRIAAPLALIAWLAACAGPSPNPVLVVQPQDSALDCHAISAEIDANNRKLEELSGVQGAKVAQNIAAGVAGLFIWPAWFAMDLQGSAGIEIDALQSRQKYLAELAGKRGCGASVAAGS